MIVRTLEQILASDRNVETDLWASRRFLLQNDGLGFTLTETTIEPGAELTIHYKNHYEACYCVEGQGEVVGLEPEAAAQPIAPGTMYALDKHDRHILRAKSRMKLICVFNPPLTGREVHQKDGSYGLAE